MAIAYSSSGYESGYRRGRRATTRAPGPSGESALHPAGHPAGCLAPNLHGIRSRRKPPVAKNLPKNRRNEFVGESSGEWFGERFGRRFGRRFGEQLGGRFAERFDEFFRRVAEILSENRRNVERPGCLVRLCVCHPSFRGMRPARRRTTHAVRRTRGGAAP